MSFILGHKNCINCNCKSHIFRNLKPDELEQVNQNRFEIHYRGGETLFKQGSPATHVLSFTSGLAKMTLETFDQNLIPELI